MCFYCIFPLDKTAEWVTVYCPFPVCHSTQYFYLLHSIYQQTRLVGKELTLHILLHGILTVLFHGILLPSVQLQLNTIQKYTIQ